MPDTMRVFRGVGALLGRGGEGSVEEEGGRWSAGIIRDAAVITRGEALGHGFWIDAVMLKQTAKGINSVNPVARYTHPSWNDSLGSVLGRWANARVDGDKVRADLHFHASARKAPGGDRPGYILSLAEEDPASFGVSIAFAADMGAEDSFVREHTKKGKFESPDKLNVEGFPHARIAELMAADVVAEPAANPDGLFRRKVIDSAWRRRANARAVEVDRDG